MVSFLTTASNEYLDREQAAMVIDTVTKLLVSSTAAGASRHKKNTHTEMI